MSKTREYKLTFVVQAEHKAAAHDEVYKRLQMGGDADVCRQMKQIEVEAKKLGVMQ